MYDEFIVAEAQINDDTTGLNMPPIKKITLQDSQSEAEKRMKYPVVYQVGKDNKVRVWEKDTENCFDDEGCL